MRPIPMLLAAVLAAACSEKRSVELLFGPDPQTLTNGFQCVDGMSMALYKRALVGSGSNTQLEMRLVVDVLDLGGAFPTCNPDQLARSCQNPDPNGPPRCQVPTPPAPRSCFEITMPPVSGTKAAIAASILAALNAQLKGKVIVGEAPHVPVIVRIVATTQTCDEVQAGGLDGHSVFKASSIVGCAHSCPVTLDDVAGSLQVFLDTLNNKCEEAAVQCATFEAPNGPAL